MQEDQKKDLDRLMRKFNNPYPTVSAGTLLYGIKTLPPGAPITEDILYETLQELESRSNPPSPTISEKKENEVEKRDVPEIETEDYSLCRIADHVFNWEFENRRAGGYFIRALHCLVHANFVGESEQGYIWYGKQTDLKRFCEETGFNSWKKLAQFMTINRKKINPSSIRAQVPSLNSPAWDDISSTMPDR
jgi:hypothetical protein